MSDIYNIDMRSYRIIGWISFFLSFVGTVSALLAREYFPALGFVVLSLVGLYIALGAGVFQINSRHIEHRSYFGTWQITWNEISDAEIGIADGTIILKGENKRFVLSPPSWWSCSNKDEILEFVFNMLESRGVTLISSKIAAYKTMKNTRV